MGIVTLKDYFIKLDEYKNDIDNKINFIFMNEKQSFSFDNINLVDARVNDDNLFIKLRIVNYNGSDKNYSIEIFKNKEQIYHVIYVKRPLGIGIDVVKDQISLNIIYDLIELLKENKVYFSTLCDKRNILLLFKITKPTDDVLESIELDTEKLPNFVNNGIRR